MHRQNAILSESWRNDSLAEILGLEIKSIEELRNRDKFAPLMLLDIEYAYNLLNGLPTARQVNDLIIRLKTTLDKINQQASTESQP